MAELDNYFFKEFKGKYDNICSDLIEKEILHVEVTTSKTECAQVTGENQFKPTDDIIWIN